MAAREARRLKCPLLLARDLFHGSFIAAAAAAAECAPTSCVVVVVVDRRQQHRLDRFKRDEMDRTWSAAKAVFERLMMQALRELHFTTISSSMQNNSAQATTLGT